MDVTPLVRKGQQIIQSYANGVFKINGQCYETPLMVTPDQTQIWEIDGKDNVTALGVDDFSALISIAADVDVVLLGCGQMMTFLAPELQKDLRMRGVSIDIMDTGAACRTYNVLMAEGRRVACLLLPV